MSEWLMPLQVLLNNALKYDVVSQRKISALAGKIIVLSMTDPRLSLSVSVEPDGFIFLATGESASYDARVAGKASDLFAVMKATDRTAAMMAHEINIEGDTRTFFAIQDVMSHLDVDWEMALGDKVGDMTAHVIADGVRFFGSIVKNQIDSMSRTSRNFFREESGWMVPDSLWQDHQYLVQSTRTDVERLAARMRRMEQRIAQQCAERDA